MLFCWPHWALLDAAPGLDGAGRPGSFPPGQSWAQGSGVRGGLTFPSLLASAFAQGVCKAASDSGCHALVLSCVTSRIPPAEGGHGPSPVQPLSRLRSSRETGVWGSLGMGLDRRASVFWTLVFSLQPESSDVIGPVGQTVLHYLSTLIFIFYCSVWVGKIPWRREWLPHPGFLGLPCGSDRQDSACSAGDPGSQEDPLEEGMATHSSIFVYRVPQTMGS